MRLLGALLLASFVVACSGPAPASAPAEPTPTPPSAATVPPPTSDAIPTMQPPPTPIATITAGSNTPTSAYVQLLTYVPAVIAATCSEIDPTPTDALAVARCEPDDVIVDPDAWIDSVVYFWYDADFKRLDAWADRWEQLGMPTGSECSAGPSTNTYTVDGQIVGRIVCGPDPHGGLVAWWYDDRLEVVMTVLLLEGTYEDLASLVELTTAQP